MRTAIHHIHWQEQKAWKSLGLLLLLAFFMLLAPGLHAQTGVAVIGLNQKATENLQLRPLWQFAHAAAGAQLNPEAVWQLPASEFKTEDRSVNMSLGAKHAYVARFQVQQALSDFSSYITVPSPHLDKVELWYRHAHIGYSRLLLNYSGNQNSVLSIRFVPQPPTVNKHRCRLLLHR